METEARRFELFADLFFGKESWSDKDDAFVRAKIAGYERGKSREKRGYLIYEFVLRYLKFKRYHESESFQSLWIDPPDGYTREEWMNRYGETPQILDNVNRPTSPCGCAQRVCDYLRIPFVDLIANDLFHDGYDSDLIHGHKIRTGIRRVKAGRLVSAAEEAQRQQVTQRDILLSRLSQADRVAFRKTLRAKRGKQQVTSSVNAAALAMEDVAWLNACQATTAWTRTSIQGRDCLETVKAQRTTDAQLDIVRARRQRAKAYAVLFKVGNTGFFPDEHLRLELREPVLHVADETFLDKYREGLTTVRHTDRESSNKKQKRGTVDVDVLGVKELQQGKTVTIQEHDYNAIAEMRLQQVSHLRWLDYGWGKSETRSALDIDCDVTEDGRIWRCALRGKERRIGPISKLSELKLLTLLGPYIGSIPSSFGNLQNLQVFRLVGTMVENLPEEIGNLAGLKILDLSNNFGITSLPISIGNLKHLEEINLDYTQIEELPVEFYNDSSLRRFYANTMLGFRIPPNIQGMKKLEYFHVCVEGVCLEGDLPREMTNLESLTELHVKDFIRDEIISIPDEIKCTLSGNRFKAKVSFGEWTESSMYTNKLWPLMLSKAPREDAVHYLLRAGLGSFLNMLTNSRHND